jgi:hypothetical protein
MEIISAVFAGSVIGEGFGKYFALSPKEKRQGHG